MKKIMVLLFTTISSILYAQTNTLKQVELITPADKETQVGLLPTLTWHSAKGVAGYQVWVAFTQDFTAGFYVSDILEDTTLQLATWYLSTTFFWKVKCFGENNDTVVSETWRFKTFDAIGVRNESKQNIKFSCFPNPISTIANFHFDVLKTPSFFEIFDFSGRSLLREEISAGQASLPLDMRSYPAEIYFARLANTTLKLVKN